MVVSNGGKRGAAQVTRSVTARLLVLGDKQVGKSAAIVRYTTGRFIQEYSDAASNWLYRHPLGYQQKRNQNISVELLEQRDIQFCNSGNFFASLLDRRPQQQQQQNQTLALRAAQDQQLADELQAKQEMLDKLQWADAYVVVYAINDRSTFNKAIKYLNLIANNINSPAGPGQKHSCGSSSSSSSSCSGNGSIGSGGSNIFNRLSPATQINGHGPSGKLSPGHHSGNCSCASSNSTRRPILLLGNKKDLERSDRQVGANDGRLLAMRHQSTFAELSIAESNKLIESYLANLVEQIEPTSLHLDAIAQPNQTDPSRLVSWKPTVEAALSQSGLYLSAPVWASLIRSKPLESAMLVQSSKVAGTKLEASEVHSLKPAIFMAQTAEVGAVVRGQASSCSVLQRNSVSSLSSISVKSNQAATRCSSYIPPSGHTSHNYQNRYKNLKSSFKRASMAIVGSKTLSKSSNKAADLKRCSTTSSEQDSFSELSFTSSGLGSAGLGYDHCRQSAGCDTSTKGDSLPPTVNSNPQQSGEKFRRPLFRYRGRRTTVAFEEMGQANGFAGKCSASQLELNQSKLSLSNKADARLEAINSDGASSEDSARNYSARSSSSLSTSDTNCGSSLMLCDLDRQTGASSVSTKSSSCSSRSNRTASLTLTRRNSNTTFSDDATSGSCEESAGENPSKSIGSKVVGRIDPSSGSGEQLHQQSSELSTPRPPTAGKKRYDLVRSVQNTLSSLTRSSNVSSAGHAPKRSFCSTLFRPHTSANATLTVKNVTEPPVVAGVAKAEHLGPMPVMIGFCK